MTSIAIAPSIATTPRYRQHLAEGVAQPSTLYEGITARAGYTPRAAWIQRRRRSIAARSRTWASKCPYATLRCPGSGRWRSAAASLS